MSPTRLLAIGPGSALGLVLAAGCHGQTTFHRARALEYGESETTLSVDAVGTETADELETTVALEGRWRIGVGGDVDVGVGTSGFLEEDLYSLQGDVNWAFARAGSCVFALDPTIALARAFDISTTLLWLPLLADVYDDGRTSVTLAAKYGRIDLHGVPDSELVTITESGSLLSFGVGVRVALSAGFALMPELSVMVPAFDLSGSEPLYILGLGFVWL